MIPISPLSHSRPQIPEVLFWIKGMVGGGNMTGTGCIISQIYDYSWPLYFQQGKYLSPTRNRACGYSWSLRRHAVMKISPAWEVFSGRNKYLNTSLLLDSSWFPKGAEELLLPIPSPSQGDQLDVYELPQFWRLRFMYYSGT